MKQPYSDREINEKKFTETVDKIVKNITNLKGMIYCYDSLPDDVECSDDCPIKCIYKDLSKVQFWGMIRKTLPDKK